MQKLGISLLFFTLCFTTASFAQGKSKTNDVFPNVDSLFASLNIDNIMHSVNIDSLMHRVNIDSIMHRVNIDSIMHTVNIDSIMRRVNIDSLIGRFNLDSLWKANRSKIEGYFKADGSTNNLPNENYASSKGVIGENDFVVGTSDRASSGTISTNSFGSKGTVRIGNNFYGSNVYVDTLWGNHKLTPKELKQLGIMRNGPDYYFAQNGKQYYMNIIPPAQKGKRVDDSYVWLLGSR